MTVMTRRLGRSDLPVSALGLGCWAIGGAMAAGEQQLGYAGVDDDLAVRALHRAVELGITLFDTADAYGAGHSERLLAGVLAEHPDVLVATKFGNTIDEASRQLTGVDTSPAYVRQALHASLRRLNRDRVDLYQLHTPDVDDNRATELVATLEDLASEGLIGWYGISTDDPGRAEIFASGPRCTAVQLQLNVLDDNPDMLCPVRAARPGRTVPLTAGDGAARRPIHGDESAARRRHPRPATRMVALVRRRPPRAGVPGSASTPSGTSSPPTAAPCHRARWAGSGRTTHTRSRCPGSATPHRSPTMPPPSSTAPSARMNTRRSRPSWIAGPAAVERTTSHTGVVRTSRAMGERQSLARGQSLANGRTRLILRRSGNLAVTRNGHTLWASRTAHRGAVKLVLTSSGALRLYTRSGRVVWSTRYIIRGNHIYLTVRTSGDVQLRDLYGDRLWHTATAAH